MDYRIEEVTSKIKESLSQTPNIEQMAKSINVSTSYIQHLFKREVGTSISQYIKELRLQKAREFLETTHFRVKEIRLKIGAIGETHFQQDFKKKFGKTPNAYRKWFRNNRISQ